MYEMMLNSKPSEETDAYGNPDTIVFIVAPNASATTIPLGVVRGIGSVTFDTGESFPFSIGNTNTNVNVTIPAAATRMTVVFRVNSTGTAVPLFSLSPTPSQNDRIMGIESWGIMDARFTARFRDTNNFITVPRVAPSWESLGNLFFNSKSFNQDVSMWNMSHVTDTRAMFYGCVLFNQPVNTWNTTKFALIGSMFCNCSSFNQPLNNWNVNGVTAMEDFLSGASAFNQNLSNLTFPQVTVTKRNGYDTRATAWQSGNKPNFAIK